MRKLSILIWALFLIGACTQTEEQEMTSEQVEMTSVVGEEVTYSTDDVTMNGYMAYDESIDAQRPGILVVHEWWGHDEHARKSAEKLAELGYVALAVDMYGQGKKADHPDDAMQFSSEVMGNFDQARARFNAAFETLQTNPDVDPERIGAMGYCFGGSVVLSMAHAGIDLDGVVAFHAGLQLPVMPGEEVYPSVLILNGADDPMVTDEQVETLTTAYDAANADYEYIEYEGATHAYTNPAADSLGETFDLPLAYHAEADSMSWEAMKEFFEATFSSAAL